MERSLKMNEIRISHDYCHDAQSVWELLEDFANIERWWPKGDGAIRIEKVVLEGEGIGLTRHIYNEGFPHAISERLDYLDPENRVYKLSMVDEIPAGITEYQATGKIVETDKGCRLEYFSQFSADEKAVDTAREFLLGAYDLMFNGLDEALSKA